MPALRERPQLFPDLEASFEIFWELSSMMPIDGMSGHLGAIPFSEIESYFRLYKIDNYEKTLERILMMDSIYRELINKR